jgi:hypothetical protein
MTIRLPLSIIVIVFALSSKTTLSQYFSSANYKKALWMTTRYYGGQRSGSNNWLVHNYLPAGVASKYKGKCFIDDNDAGYDLSGGWHDAGDHVKFGQTQFYSAYMLLKGFAEFPTGYDDRYSATYTNYGKTGKWSWEENAHDPNGIPDLLDEVKHATDFFIKCAKNSYTFYYQVGQGAPDHTKWVTAVYMQTLPKSEGGQLRTVYKNPNDASMASFCGASLALMSRLYAKYDTAYASLCLTHATYAYNYAKAHPGTAGAGDNAFYGPNGNWKDDYASMCAELYWTTKTESYKTEALSFSVQDAWNGDIHGSNYIDYSNNGDIALYNLALLGKPSAQYALGDVVSKIYFANVGSDGQYSGGNLVWGPLRYNANSAFSVALWQKLNGTDGTVHKYIYDNIDYILGKNNSNLSFVVGFGANCAKHPHHRTVYLNDSDPTGTDLQNLSIPAKNTQFGLMVGGSRIPSQYKDFANEYQYTEGGIDYNACLVGVLGFINSKIAPVDTSKFKGLGIYDINTPSISASAYPNPSTSSFTIQSSVPTNVKVFDNMGGIVAEFELLDHKNFGSELASGIYHVVFCDKNNVVRHNMNVVKQ